MEFRRAARSGEILGPPMEGITEAVELQKCNDPQRRSLHGLCSVALSQQQELSQFSSGLKFLNVEKKMGKVATDDCREHPQKSQFLNRSLSKNSWHPFC
jgi:hypothetical protein